MRLEDVKEKETQNIKQKTNRKAQKGASTFFQLIFDTNEFGLSWD